MSKRAFVALGLMITASVLWNGWLIGWLNHGSAGYLRMSISELNVVNQPHYVLFTALEYLSGVFLLLGSSFLLVVVRQPARLLTFIIMACICFLGVLTIYDAAYPLNCNQYNNSVCAANNSTGDVSASAQKHINESKLTSFLTGFLGLFIVLWFYLKKNYDWSIIAALLLLIVIVGTLEVLDNSNHVFADAIAERIWNVAVSIDILLITYKILPTNNHSVKTN